jgi:hypothetical protein
MSIDTLKALLEEADPSSGTLYSGLPTPIVFDGHASVRSLLGVILDADKVADLEPAVQQALDTEGVWIGEGTAIYRLDA